MSRRDGAMAAGFARMLTVAALLGVLLVTGCSQLPPTHYYLLELTPPPAASPSAAAGASGADGAEPQALTIGVRPFAVDAPYDQDRIVYRVGERSPEVGFYAYHLWAAPLSSMLPAGVASGLGGADGVALLESAVAGHRYDAFLHGRVLAVEEIDLSDRQLVRASIELRLRAPDGAELWSHVVEARGETRTEEVADIVEAIAAALAEALVETRAELGQAIAGLERASR
jgi:uncharacterized lipoprotein YmbA